MTTTNQALARNAQMNRPGMCRQGSGSPNWMAVSWDAVVNFLAPLGYENESGFHYGKQPVPHGKDS